MADKATLVLIGIAILSVAAVSMIYINFLSEQERIIAEAQIQETLILIQVCESQGLVFDVETRVCQDVPFVPATIDWLLGQLEGLGGFLGDFNVFDPNSPAGETIQATLESLLVYLSFGADIFNQFNPLNEDNVYVQAWENIGNLFTELTDNFWAILFGSD